MERVTFKNSRNQNLVGNLYSAKSKSIIVMAHGFTGDKSESGRFDRIAEALNGLEYDVLSFDFSGCGESDDDTLTVEKQVDDLRSALQYVKSDGYNQIGLFGHSLGGLIALRCYSQDISTIVLWAPVTEKVKYEWNTRFSPEQLQELTEKGYITKIREKGVRRRILIDKQMLTDRETVNQEELLKDINCPVLIVHGDADPHVPYTDSENAMKYLSKDSKLEVVAGADHHFSEHLDVLIDLSKKWLVKHIQP